MWRKCVGLWLSVARGINSGILFVSKADTNEEGTAMDIRGIFNNHDGGNYWYWLDCLDDDEVKRAVYFCDADTSAYHKCFKSALYNDMTGYQDELQCEDDLSDNELYVVTYFKCLRDVCELDQLVDFGITKQEIIDNVKHNKYVEGASYFTMGQMFYTTRKMMEEMQD